MCWEVVGTARDHLGMVSPQGTRCQETCVIWIFPGIRSSEIQMWTRNSSCWFLQQLRQPVLIIVCDQVLTRAGGSWSGKAEANCKPDVGFWQQVTGSLAGGGVCPCQHLRMLSILIEFGCPAPPCKTSPVCFSISP